MKKFKLMKVFDIYDFPQELKEKIYNFYSYPYHKENDSVIKWTVGEITDIEEYIEGYNQLNTWLKKHGANDNENVLILYWW